MKKTLKRTLASILVVLMLLTSAPLQGLTQFEFELPDWFSSKAEAAGIGTYNATAAVQYARKYALSYNKEWYFYVNGGDCANFVSQSLYVAGVPMTANWHSYDGNTFAYLMKNNYTWIRAQELMDYLISIGGVRINNPKPSDFSVGDAVFYNWNGGRIDHSALVTKIDGGVPKVSCHSTPEMASQLDAHWTLGKDKSCAVLIKLYGATCTENSVPDYDYYRVVTSTGLYSSPNSGFITTVPYRYTVRVTEKTSYGGKTWGKFNFKGTWGWIDLTKAVYVGHRDNEQITHDFGNWYTVKQATCIDKGLERRDCRRCGYQQDREIGPGGHVEKAPATCTAAAICKACGITLTPALGHDFTEWVLITTPTCIQKAVYERTCKRGDRTETKEGDFGPHNYVANITVPGCVNNGESTSTCTYCGDSYVNTSGWSDWEEISSADLNGKYKELLSNPELFEKKTQYRYRDKQYTESNNSTLDGWTYLEAIPHIGAWGSWSGWSTTPASASNTREVQTGTRYNMETFNTMTTNSKREFRDYSVNGNYSANGLSSTYGEFHYTEVYDSTNGLNGLTAIAPGAYAGEGVISFPGTNRSSKTGYVLPHGTYTYIFFNNGQQTIYRYRDRTYTYTYKFWRWPAWQNNWSDSKPASNSDREIQERTVYRFKLAALGHNYGDPVTVAPTCLEQGYTQITCKRCGLEYKYDYVAALGHDWCAWYTVIEAKPGQDGLDRRDCQRCGIYETRGHTLTATVIDPTCTEQGYTIYKCSDEDCSVEYITDYVDPLGHDLRKDAPEVITYPTCTEEGEQKFTCTRCDYYETEAIPALGHDYDRDNDGDVDTDDAVETVDATCLKDGYYYFECENASEHNYTETIKATGHDMCDWKEVVAETCGDEGYFWRECQNEYCDISVESRGETKRYYEEKDNYFIRHNYGEIIEFDPTCTEDGYATQTCEICGDVIMYEGELALGHDWGEWYSYVDATCTEEGIDRQDCQRCGIHNDEVSPALGHDDISEAFNATCVAEPYIKNTCQRCSRVEIISDGDIDPDAHDMGGWYLEIAPTCTEPGYNRRDCQRNCGYFEREIIPVTGHDYQVTEDTDPTCTDEGKLVEECQNDGCDAVIETKKPALGHKFSTTVIDPTCTEKGYTLYECQRDNCDYSEKRDEVAELGHNMGQWTTVELPTDKKEGLERRDCSRGDKTETRPIPMLKVFKATFVADEVVVAVVEFVEGDTELSYVPDVPDKDRYNEKWENYTLKNEDIVINAVYTLIPPDGLSDIETEKEAIADEETRDVTIKLSASSDAETIISQTVEKTPLDVILVVDQSGSMEGAKLESLKLASEEIAELIYEEARMNDVDHRMAIVGFAMGSTTQNPSTYPAYMNSEILTTGGAPVQYSSKASTKLNNAYKNALVSVNKNGSLNSTITKAIDAIEAGGATAANVGLTMAANVFAQNSIEGTNRTRVVIFMTDGEPTSWADYDEKDVANPAIKIANQLKSEEKNGCNATIFSIGIDCNTKTNKKFLNAVSSNYDSVASMSSNISTDTNDYFMYSDNIDELDDMFIEAIRDEIINTTDFKDITLVDTVSKYFTMTSQQETALRESVIAEYGIANEDITVTRNSDGTTTVKIAHLDPKPVTGADGKVKYIAQVEFTVSANANALLAGKYETNTDDAGVILSGLELYEKLFDKQSVSFSEDRGAAIFKINDVIYQITSVEIGGLVLPPDYRIETGYSFSDWDVPEDYILNGGTAEFNAVLRKGPYTVTWTMGKDVVTQTYYADDYIYAPEAPKTMNGLTFVGWNTTIPVTMPEENLAFTACYRVHTHNYVTVETVRETCVKDGLLTHTCSCGISYTETVPAMGGEHEWLAITSEAALDNLSLEEFRCNKCNEYMSRSLVYKVVAENHNNRGDGGTSEVIYDFTMYDETATLVQPGNKVIISMPVPDGMEYADSIIVYRIEDNGDYTKLTSTYSKEDMHISFETDHFCQFRFVAAYGCNVDHKHPDANGDYICDDCLIEMSNPNKCSMCDTNEQYKDIPVIGWIVSLVHFFIHFAYQISYKS